MNWSIFAKSLDAAATEKERQASNELESAAAHGSNAMAASAHVTEQTAFILRTLAKAIRAGAGLTTTP